MRAVVDTNILVRSLIKPAGPVGPVLDCLRDGKYTLLYSDATLEELVDVLARPRMREKYGITDEVVEAVIRLVLLRGEGVDPSARLSVCRDPKDDKFLELAVEGEADLIVSGDDDLQVLDPYENIPVVSPAELLQRLE